MTEKVRLLRPSAFADRAELFYSDINGRTLSLVTENKLIEYTFSFSSRKDFSAEMRAGFSFSPKSEFYIAEYLVHGGEDFLDFRKKLIEKEEQTDKYGLNLKISCYISIRIFDKTVDGIKLPEGFFAFAPIANPKINIFLDELFGRCKRAGVDIDYYYAEGDGLATIFLSGSFCEIADKIVLFKVIAKRLSERSDLAITFMPKPFFDKKGGGLGLEVSVSGDKRLNFFEGIILHCPESLCMICSTVNSFARLKEMSGYICHGKGEDVLFQTEEKEDVFNFKFDFGDLLGNTYITFCAIIESGIMGIEQNLALRDGVEEVTPSVQKETGRIPFSLEEALEIGWSSGFITSTLGESAARIYFAEKKKECESLDKTSAESEHIARYFDLY